MARKKLKRLKEVHNLPNVFSWEDDNVEELLDHYFGNGEPFTLEIGCGHGDYSIELAIMYPERNFIGIDNKGDRIYAAAEKAIGLNLKNAAFLVSGAEKLSEIFGEEKVEEIVEEVEIPVEEDKQLPEKDKKAKAKDKKQEPEEKEKPILPPDELDDSESQMALF